MIELDKTVAKAKPSGRPLTPPWYDHDSSHPSDALTPTKLAALLREAEDGDITRQAELYEDILDKDPTIFSALDTRKGAVLSKPWELVPREGATESRARRQIARIQSALDRMSLSRAVLTPGSASELLTFPDLLAYLLDATGRGFVAAAIDWDTKSYEPIAARQVAQKHFIVAQRTKLRPDYDPYELRFRTLDSSVDGEEIPPHRFIFHFSRDKSGLPSRLGLLRTLAWWYLFKNYGVKHYVRYAERYGNPLVYGQYDPNATEAEIAVLETAVKNLGSDAGAVLSTASHLSSFDAKQQDKGELYLNLVALVNTEISKAVLGRSSATELNPGSLGGEDHTEQVQAFRIQRDARALEDTINTYLIEPMALWTEGETLCYFKIRYEPEEEQNAKADRYSKLIAAGLPIGSKHMYEAFDIPEPGEGEETVTPPNADPMASIAAAMAAPAKANGRRLANSSLYANAAPGRSRAARVARKLRAIAETDALERSAASRMEEAYRVLVDGLPVNGDAPDLIYSDDFRAAFRPVVEDMLRSAMDISARENLATDFWAGEKTANKIDPFAVRSLGAQAWLEFQVLVLTEIETESITIALAKRIKDALVSFQSSGMTPREFYAYVLDSEGIGSIGRGHLQTVLRTNVATARAAATEITVQKNPEKYPAWQFMAVIDDRTRADHAALDGMVFSWNDRKYWPPLDYNCRCEGSPIHATELAEESYEIASGAVQDTEVPRGFGADSRVNYARWVDEQRRSNESLRERLDTLTF